jgi:hypothetical protein
VIDGTSSKLPSTLSIPSNLRTESEQRREEKSVMEGTFNRAEERRE